MRTAYNQSSSGCGQPASNAVAVYMSRSPILATLLCLGLFSGLAFAQQGSQRDPAWKAVAAPKLATAPATATSAPAPARTTQAVAAQSPQPTPAAKSSGA